eukprot:scaffold11840_cov41-Cyclotella_meneghiniana.AAC.3
MTQTITAAIKVKDDCAVVNKERGHQYKYKMEDEVVKLKEMRLRLQVDHWCIFRGGRRGLKIGGKLLCVRDIHRVFSKLRTGFKDKPL